MSQPKQQGSKTGITHLVAVAALVAPLAACTASQGAPDTNPSGTHEADAGADAREAIDAQPNADALATVDAKVHADAHVAPDTGVTLDSGSGGDAASGTDAKVDTDALPPGTQTYENLEKYMVQIANGGADQCTTVGANKYCGGSCNGSCAGSSALSTYSIDTGLATPSMGGTSSRVDVSGATSDTLEWVKIDPAAKGSGTHANDTHFVWDFYFYPTATEHVQAYEFDAFFSSNGWWLMMGSQCDLASGNWNGWNQATGHWTTSSVGDCGSFFNLNAWNHVVIRYHRDPGAVTGATKYYYDGLEVNGVSHTWGLPGYLGTNNGWGDVVGAQVQQDLESSFTGTLSSYYESFTFEISP